MITDKVHMMLKLPDATIGSSNITADLDIYKTRIHELCTSTEQHNKITDFIQKQALFMKDCMHIAVKAALILASRRHNRGKCFGANMRFLI